MLCNLFLVDLCAGEARPSKTVSVLLPERQYTDRKTVIAVLLTDRQYTDEKKEAVNVLLLLER